MSNQKVTFKTERELQKSILQEKIKGTPDIEIGKKYGVTFRYIEKLITKSQGINISALNVHKKIKTLYPKDFQEEQTTVWSFKQRGKWATHSGEYRGNWSPYIPRNVILKYSKPGETVLDYFCGAGTTAVEAKLLGRKCIALDINGKAIELAKKNLDFPIKSHQLTFIDGKNNLQIYEPELMINDARDLSFLEDGAVDLICAHPPYSNIIQYTDSKKDDLSYLDINDFLKEMTKVARESFRVLKPGRQCAILIGDTRKKKHIIPLGFKLIDVYLKAGFRLKELVIKRQHNCKTTGFWYTNSIKYNFLLLAHEYLTIFEKPETPHSSRVKERDADYTSVIPSIVEKIPLKRKLEAIETTTVWILPSKDFEKRLNKNVVDRYAKEGNYSTITFVSPRKNEAKSTKQMNKKLLFIKSPFLNKPLSLSNIGNYLEGIKEIMHQELPDLNEGGFVVIQTSDVRIDGYIEPLAKKIVDMLNLDNLWLREIIILVQDGENSVDQHTKNYLKIVHQYLLVYEVKKEKNKWETL